MDVYKENKKWVGGGGEIMKKINVHNEKEKEEKTTFWKKIDIHKGRQKEERGGKLEEDKR